MHCQSHSTLQLPMCCCASASANQSLLVTADRLFLVHRGQIKSTITLHPTKGEDMAMSVTTTNLASLIEGIPRRRNGS